MGRGGAIDAVSDLVLLTLLENERRGSHRLSGTTRLQKLLFVLSQSPEYSTLVREGRAPAIEFEPYRMGPFTREVYQAVDVLADFTPSLVIADRAAFDRTNDVELDHYFDEVDLDRAEPAVASDPRPTMYHLTPQGRRVAQVLADSAPESLMEAVRRIVADYGSLSLTELLRRVYREYPRWTVKSEIRSQIGLS